MASLPGSKLDAVQWDPDRACLDGTRQQLLGDIIEWAHNPESERIMWLSGGAGTGKSSVANSVAQRLDSVGRLGASFRFDRAFATPDTPGQLFGNLCHQLALFDDQLRTGILSAVRKHGSGGAMSLRQQARTLLVEPTLGCGLIGPVVIMIDALDESGIDEGQSKATRRSLVNAIVHELPSFPDYIKVLITSRDEGSILQLMPECPSCLCKRMADAEDTEKDILSYIHRRMGQIKKRRPDPLQEWPGETKEAELAMYADGLFIWADVACKFLESRGDPDMQLEMLLISDKRVQAEVKLDYLFDHVMRSSFESIGEDNWHYVVDSIVALKTPLTYRDMDLLLGLPTGLQGVALVNGRHIVLTTSHGIISSLRPVLRIDSDMRDDVRLLHKSIFDFLTGRADDSIRVDLDMQHGMLALRCLEFMNQKLHYDICGIGDTSLLNSEVSGLAGLVHEHIPEALRYACRHFSHHLNDMSRAHQEVTEKLQRFMTEHLLHWIEVMGLLKELPAAEQGLQVLSDYLTVSFILRLFESGLTFVTEEFNYRS